MIAKRHIPLIFCGRIANRTSFLSIIRDLRLKGYMAIDCMDGIAGSYIGIVYV